MDYGCILQGYYTKWAALFCVKTVSDVQDLSPCSIGKIRIVRLLLPQRKGLKLAVYSSDM